MQISMLYCTHCLKKFFSDKSAAREGRLYFFVPAIDDLQRQFYAYISVLESDVDVIFASEEARTVDLSHYAEVLHVEEGDWPSSRRAKEIQDFYYPVNVTVGCPYKLAAA